MLSWGVHPTRKCAENHKHKPHMEVKMSRRHIRKVLLKEVNEINFSTTLWVTQYLELIQNILFQHVINIKLLVRSSTFSFDAQSSQSSVHWTFAVVQPLSCVHLFVTPETAARQASRSLLRLMSIKSVMPSNHLFVCRPLLLLFSVFPSIGVLANESVLCM